MDSNHRLKTYLFATLREKPLTLFNQVLVQLSSMVGPSGLEPPTSCLSGTRSNLLSYDPMWYLAEVVLTLDLPCGGDDGIRTHDPLLAGQVLSQLSYTPIF